MPFRMSIPALCCNYNRSEQQRLQLPSGCGKNSIGRAFEVIAPSQVIVLSQVIASQVLFRP